MCQGKRLKKIISNSLKAINDPCLNVTGDEMNVVCCMSA